VRIIFDDMFDENLKEYLMTQDGIESIDLKVKDFMCEMNIEFNHKITPRIIMYYISLFHKSQIPVMLGFDKGMKENCKVLKYKVNDMCCEYCYKSLVEDLFNNEFVNSVKSNFFFHNPAFDIEFLIEYSDSYDKNKLIKYIKEKIN